mgnify:FL=1
MIIEETQYGHAVKVERAPPFAMFEDLLDLKQAGEWIQIDKQQAAQLVEVLQKWLAGEEVE